MKQRLRIIIVLSLCSSFITESQNLVPNPGFEKGDTTICFVPNNYLIFNIDYAPWDQFNSADIFNMCDTSHTAQSQGVPSNFIGYQYPHNGRGYVGLIAYNTYLFCREYIEVPLISSLIAGHTYYVTMHVSLGDTIQYAIENIGALFTDTLFNPFPTPWSWVTGIPQIENQAGNMLNDKTNWMSINNSFVAQGGEKYMTIGNFRDDANTTYQYLGGTVFNTLEAYYYIDDIYVGETPSGLEEKEKENNIKLYPNPANTIINIENTNGNLADSKIEITNVFGQLQLTNAEIKSSITTLNIESLSAGIYLIKIISKSGSLISVSKFVKE